VAALLGRRETSAGGGGRREGGRPGEEKNERKRGPPRLRALRPRSYDVSRLRLKDTSPERSGTRDAATRSPRSPARRALDVKRHRKTERIRNADIAPDIIFAVLFRCIRRRCALAARDNDARNKRRRIWRNYLRSAGIRDGNARSESRASPRECTRLRTRKRCRRLQAGSKIASTKNRGARWRARLRHRASLNQRGGESEAQTDARPSPRPRSEIGPLWSGKLR